MRLVRTLAATAVASALVIAPIAVSSAAAKPAPKARFVISALALVGPSTVDASAAATSVKFRVQVKDFDKKFDPKSVKVVVVKRTAGIDTATSFVATARLVGKSKVVSNWQGSIAIAIAKDSAPATYCLILVKVADDSKITVDSTAMAKGLRGRDCFTVT